jgi:hypothetical protein
MKNYANSIEYQTYLKQYDYIFNNAYFVNNKEIKLTEKFKVFVENYNHSYHVSKNYGYSISCQKIHLLNNENKSIYQLKLVFGTPFFQYIKHSNNDEYFICGNDLLDFSIFNISKNRETKFVSEYVVNDDTEEDCNNEFWYIKEWIYNPQNNLVAINGQDGMNCATVTVCDFTQPDKLPLIFKNLSQFVLAKHGDYTCRACQWTEENGLELIAREKNPQTMILEEREIFDLLNDKQQN